MKQGDKVKFKGYMQSMAEDEAVFSVGDVLEVVSFEVDDDGDKILLVTNDDEQAEVYYQEVEKIYDFVEDQLSDQEVLSLTKKLVDDINKSYYNLGKYCLDIESSAMHETLGYTGPSGFRNYVEQYLGFDFEKIRHCIRIYRNLYANDVGESDIEGMGYTKAIHVARHLTEENKDELLELAKDPESTVSDVRAKISEQFQEEQFEPTEEDHSMKVGKEKLPTWTFKLAEGPGQVFHSILAKADAQFGCNGNMNEVIYQIAMYFADTLEGVKVPVDEDLKHFNAKHGTNFSIQDVNRSREQ